MSGRVRRRGVTLIELTIVVAVIGILASAFVSIAVPIIKFYFYYPHMSRVNDAAADLMKIIIEGDAKARGLRFAGPACKIGGVGGGNNITAASTSGTVSTLTYNYSGADYCGSGAPRLSHTVTLTYDSSTGKVTRAIDGAAAQPVPDYAGLSSDIRFSVPGGGADLFHYFSADGTDLGSDPLAVSIGYVKNVGTNSLKSANTSLSVIVPAAGVAAGNLLAVSFAIDGVSGAISASDSKGNAYSVAANAQYASPGNGNIRTVILYSVLTTALVSGDTVTVTYPSRTSKAMSVDEYSGVNTLDAISTATGSGAAPSTGNVSTTNDDELLLAAFGVEGDIVQTFTIGGAFNAVPPPRDGTTGGTAATNAAINPAYRIVTSAGTYAASGTMSVSTDCARAVAGFYNSAIYRVGVQFIADAGNGVGEMRLKSGVQIKHYTA